MSAPKTYKESVRSRWWPRICSQFAVAPAFLLLLWDSLLWLGVFVVLPLAGILFVSLLYHALIKPPSSYYSVSARSEVVALALPAGRETSWRIEGAILCSTTALDGLSAHSGADSPCGSNRWHAHSLPEGQEQVLVLGGGQSSSKMTIEVGVESRAGGGLQMSIRSDQDGPGLGMLKLVDQGINIPLSNQLNLIWKADARPRDLVFPFIADQVRVGRDVTWSDSSFLQEGKVDVFTASDENLSKRSRVEEAELFPGDQVRLDRFDGEPPFQPKGFLRFDRPQPGESPRALTAIVFGRAESVRIERFGDSGYDFQPSRWAGISQNRALLSVGGLIVALFGLLGSYAAFREVHTRSPKQAWRAFQIKRHGDPIPAHQSPDKESNG